MIIILASWIFILVNCYLFGFALNQFIFKQKAFSVTIILGIIAITILSNIVSFFWPLDRSFLFNITFISCFYLVIYFKEIKLQLFKVKNEFLTVIPWYKSYRNL